MNNRFEIPDEVLKTLASLVLPTRTFGVNANFSMVQKLRTEMPNILILMASKIEDEAQKSATSTVEEKVAQIRAAKAAAKAQAATQMTDADFRKMILERMDAMRGAVNTLGNRLKSVEAAKAEDQEAKDAKEIDKLLETPPETDGFWDKAFKFLEGSGK
jgi:hypothetical protein